MLADYSSLLYKYTLQDSVNWLTLALSHPLQTSIAALIFTASYIRRLVEPLFRPPPAPASKPQSVSFQPGVAYLHMFPRAFTKGVPNLSPYAIKVETWCRINNVPYEVVETSQFSSRAGQIPYLILDGTEYEDSSNIIRVLADRFHVSPDTAATEIQNTATDGQTADFQVDEPEEVLRHKRHTEAIEWTVGRMMDDSFAPMYFMYRYHSHADDFARCFRVTSAPRLLQRFIHDQIGNGCKKRGSFQGFSRHGDQYMVELGNRDLRALNDILGENRYLLGDKPSMLDATVFSHLTQILCPPMPYPWKSYIQTECPALERYCERIRTEFWPDWEQIVHTGEFH